MIQKTNKKGISLIVLVITIVVLLILVSVVVLRSEDSRENARKVVFISDLTTVQDAVKSYYILNGTLPHVKDKSFSRGSLSALNPDTNLVNEINSNGDQRDTFYLVDLSLLDIDNVGMGTKYNEEGNSDIFVVSGRSLNVYYVKGKKINSNMYYSLSKKLTGAIDSQIEVEDGSETVIGATTSSDRITVVKGNSLINTIDARVIVQIKSGESFAIDINGNESSISVTEGPNIIILKDVLTEAQVSNIKTNSGKFKLLIKALNGGSVVQEKEVDMSNLYTGKTISFPTNSDSLNSYESENTITFKINADAGISYIKYDYNNVYDFSVSEGYSKYYTSISSDEALRDYVISKGKTAKASSDGFCTISLPKNVKDILVVAQDKAGNVEKATKSLYNIYAKADIITNTASTANVKVNIFAPSTSTATISYSEDNVNYSAEHSFKLAYQNSNATLNYTGISSPYIYVKTVVTLVDKSSYTFIDKLQMDR